MSVTSDLDSGAAWFDQILTRWSAAVKYVKPSFFVVFGAAQSKSTPARGGLPLGILLLCLFPYSRLSFLPLEKIRNPSVN